MSTTRADHAPPKTTRSIPDATLDNPEKNHITAHHRQPRIVRNLNPHLIMQRIATYSQNRVIDLLHQMERALLAILRYSIRDLLNIAFNILR